MQQESLFALTVGPVPSRPKASSSGVPANRVGYGRHAVNIQSVWRTIVREDDVPISPDEFRNQLEFERYVSFLSTDRTCTRHRLLTMSYRRAVIHPEPIQYALTAELTALDLPALRARLTYMSDEHSALMTRDDFRTVNTLKRAGDDRSFVCAVAGILQLDVGTLCFVFLDGLYAMGSKEDDVPRHADRRVLDACVHSGSIQYGSSGRLRGVLELNDYLRNNADALHRDRTQLLLSQFGEDGDQEAGHAVVLKYRVDDGPYTPDPRKLFIDFQVPSFVRRTNVPNPKRFTTHVDDVTYSSFVVYTIRLL